VDDEISPAITALRAKLIRQYKGEEFTHASSIGIDALVAFVPKGGHVPDPVRKMLNKDVQASWHEVDDGHLVKWPYYGGRFNRKFFRVEARGWDAIRCRICQEQILIRSSFWLLEERRSLTVNCENCHTRIHPPHSVSCVGRVRPGTRQ